MIPDRATGRTLPYATRAWSAPPPTKRTNRDPAAGEASDRSLPVPLPRHALIIDTETTLDQSQRLLFGVYRYLRRRSGLGPKGDGWDCIAEGLIYADDLPQRDPDGYQAVKDYAASNAAGVVADTDVAGEIEPNLSLLSRTDFALRWWFRAGVPHRGKWDPAAIVFFNAPFDISRMAAGVKESKRGPTLGGFSFQVMANADGSRIPYKPDVVLKHIDSKRALKANAATEGGAAKAAEYRGHYLDLRTAVFALTSDSHTLDSACDAFGVRGKSEAKLGVVDAESIKYCRDDVRATADLFEAVVTAFEKHPLERHLQLTKAYSPASLAKAYLASMGIKPLLGSGGAGEHTLPWVLGAAMSAFYGGRAECLIRRTEVPVNLVDFTSMYPSVNALMGSWNLITAERIDVINDEANTDRVQRLLNTVTAETMFATETWRDLLTLVQIQPDGDLLPVRAAYSEDNWTIGVNYFTADEPLWYTLADVIASVILTGKIPTILDALTLEANGRAPDLRAVRLLGETEIDPTADDFFTKVIEERQRRKTVFGDDDKVAAFLKIVANSGGYGIYAQLDPDQRPANVDLHSGSRTPTRKRVERPEKPGPYSYPPLAACITGAARLMLALLEHEVTALGGDWAFCDTDSMAIVATAEPGQLIPCRGGSHQATDGGPALRALSYDQVDGIREKFNRLNPYDPVVDALVKDEKKGDCVAISAKRYVIRESGTEPIRKILKASEAGLGHLLNPEDSDAPTIKDKSGARPWIRDVWHRIAESVRTGDPLALPWWASKAAHARTTVSTARLLRHFDGWNEGKTYADQIKPANFMVAAFLDTTRLAIGGDPTKVRAIAPYSKHASQSTEWINLHNPAERLNVATSPHAHAPDVYGIQSYDDVIRQYVVHPEAKFLDPDGVPCHVGSAGRLGRDHVRGANHAIIGKEANQLDEQEAGITHPAEALNVYDDGMLHHVRTNVLPELLNRHGVSALADLLGVDRKTVSQWKAGKTAPQARNVAALLAAQRQAAI